MNTPDTIIFDLDGTLLDTLDDLATSVNHALTSNGLPPRSREDIRRFLGNGIRSLVKLSVPVDTPDDLYETVFNCFRSYYVDHCLDYTQPYPGIVSLLSTLRDAGIKMGIVSNKLHPAVRALNERFFSDFIGTAVGESATVRRKPCPDGVLAAISELGSTPERTVYVGDSEVDLETANNAGTACLSVLWGFRDEDFLRRLYPDATFIHRPEEIASYLGIKP